MYNIIYSYSSSRRTSSNEIWIRIYYIIHYFNWGFGPGIKNTLGPVVIKKLRKK